MEYAVVEFANTYIGKPGNIGVRTAKIVEEASKQGIDVACICRGSTIADRPGVIFKKMGLLGHIPRILNGVRIYLAPGWNHRFLDIGLYTWFSNIVLSSLNHKSAVRIAHVWDTSPTLIRRLKDDGFRVVLDVPIAPLAYGRRLKENGGPNFLLDDLRFEKVELESFSEADFLIAPSEFVLTELVELGIPRSKIVVIEFGADFREPSGNIAASESKSGVDYCFVGAVCRRKGIIELLDAWQDERFIEDRLHLCGRVFPEVKNRLSNSRLGNVITPGFVSPIDYLPSCDVFVFPTWLEGSAKAVYEAMALGKPVITTGCAGSVVRDGLDGFVIDAGDINALRDRMLWFKENPLQVREMGQRARARVAEYTWERYAKRVVGVYDDQCLLAKGA